MNRTLKEAAVKRYHYDGHDRLREHLSSFVDAYHYAHRPKALRGLAPFEHVVQSWTEDPDRFMHDPPHHVPGSDI